MRRLQIYLWLFRKAFGAAAHFKRGRATHTHGVGARGTLTVLAHPDVPEHDFFVAGASYPLALRHATLNEADDAALDVRGATIRIGETGEGQCLDLPMNTGVTSLFWNAINLGHFMMATAFWAPGWKLFRWFHPSEYQAGVDGMRRAPDSFTQLDYHSQIVFGFQGTDGVARLIRYRLRSKRDGEESGIPSERDKSRPWKTKRSKDEQRAKNYLRQEFKSRLEGEGNVEYALEAQIRSEGPADVDVCNSNREWPADQFPWCAIGKIEIDTLLSDEDADALRFNISNHPKSLPVLEATSAADPNSLGYLRTRVYRHSQAIRAKRSN